MAQVTLAEAPEAILALSWLVVVVSMAGFSALMTSPPGVEPAGAVTAPQPATNKSSNGVATDRSVRPGLRIAAPSVSVRFTAVSQLPLPDKDREVWFSLGEKPRKSLSLRSTPIAKLPSCSPLHQTEGIAEGPTARLRISQGSHRFYEITRLRNPRIPILPKMVSDIK